MAAAPSATITRASSSTSRLAEKTATMLPTLQPSVAMVTMPYLLSRSPSGPYTSCDRPYTTANTDTTCAAWARLTANVRASSGSMASQMRCATMLENVAKDSSKMERRVAAERVAEPVVMGNGGSSKQT
jgi:hypothetical protein